MNTTIEAFAVTFKAIGKGILHIPRWHVEVARECFIEAHRGYVDSKQKAAEAHEYAEQMGQRQNSQEHIDWARGFAKRMDQHVKTSAGYVVSGYFMFALLLVGDALALLIIAMIACEVFA